MNKLNIYRNESDKIVKCECVEENDGYILESIVLPEERLNQVFFDLIDGKYKKNYKKCIESIKGEFIHFAFIDIDVDITDALIRESKMYKRTTEINHKPTLSRRNKFKKKTVQVTTSLLAVLAIYSILYTIKPSNDGFIKNTPVIPHEISYNEETPVPTQKDITNLDDEVIEKLIKTIADSSKQTKEEEIANEETYDQILSLDAFDESNSEKAFVARAYYFDTISDIASEYGIDPNLALAICTQERGLHSPNVELNGGIGLFQIQVEGNWNWNGKEISAYNFKNGSYETRTITTESASDVFENIRIGCMILQEALVQRNYNVAQAITYYNCGNYIDSNIINSCCRDTGLTESEINSDPNNLEWLNYRNNLKCGDPNYLENVFKYIESGTVLKFTKPNGENVSVIYNNMAYSRNVGRK